MKILLRKLRKAQRKCGRMNGNQGFLMRKNFFGETPEQFFENREFLEYYYLDP
jgi:hypothetical protein